MRRKGHVVVVGDNNTSDCVRLLNIIRSSAVRTYETSFVRVERLRLCTCVRRSFQILSDERDISVFLTMTTRARARVCVFLFYTHNTPGDIFTAGRLSVPKVSFISAATVSMWSSIDCQFGTHTRYRIVTML